MPDPHERYLPIDEALTPEELAAIVVPPGTGPQVEMLRRNMEEAAAAPPVAPEPLDAEQDALDQMTEAIKTNLVGS